MKNDNSAKPGHTPLQTANHPHHPKQWDKLPNHPHIDHLKVSIGIPAYNEEQNIAKLLNALGKQVLGQIHITEIIVIASGCTDGTVKKVEKIMSEWKNLPVLRLIIQTERTGKSSAVNLFIQEAKEDVLILESADTIPAPNTIEKVCEPFLDNSIGLTGAHPVPTNNPSTFIGFCVQTMWQMHHEISLKNPKCGELIAFRRAMPKEHPVPATIPGMNSVRGISAIPSMHPTPIITQIPTQSAVDEASIEAAIVASGLLVTYVPDAIVYNKGPTTINDFIAQRRRISAGHYWLRRHFGHKPSTTSKRTVLWLTLSRFNMDWKHLRRSLKHNLWLVGMTLLETWSKILGRYDYYIKKRDHMIWARIGTSKDPEITISY